MSMLLSCKKVSMAITSFGMHRSSIYLPFLLKTCSSLLQLTMNSYGNILCTLQMLTFLNLPFNLIILKFGMYFASKFDSVSKF